MLTGIFFIAISYNLFFAPNELNTGGITGLAIIIKKLFFINESLFILIMNFFLLMISFIVLGKDLTKKNIFCSILLPIAIHLTENIGQIIVIQNLELLIIALLGGVISGIGYGILYKNNFTAGGTDILNQIAEKKLKVPFSFSMLYIEGLIALLGGFILGIEKMIYAIISLIIINTLSNKSMLGIGQNKIFYIQTKKVKQVMDYLTKELNYDITIFETKGGFLNKKNKLILCSVKTKDYYKVKTALMYIDPEVFITITENYEERNANRMAHKSKKLEFSDELK